MKHITFSRLVLFFILVALLFLMLTIFMVASGRWCLCIEDTDIILTFIGLLATFIVISNHTQVSEAISHFANTKSEMKSELEKSVEHITLQQNIISNLISQEPLAKLAQIIVKENSWRGKVMNPEYGEYQLEIIYKDDALLYKGDQCKEPLMINDDSIVAIYKQDIVLNYCRFYSKLNK